MRARQAASSSGGKGMHQRPVGLRRAVRVPALSQACTTPVATASGGELPLEGFGGSAARWGFAIYLANTDRYQDSILPTGAFAGRPEDALDCAAGLYLDYPTVWT